MIYSMTGFGRAEYEDREKRLSIEIKSLNHRSFETSFYLPEGFGIFEERLRQKLSTQIKRGRIFFNLSYQRLKPPATQVVLNRNLAKQVTAELKILCQSLGIKNTLQISDIISLPNIIQLFPKPESKLQLSHLVFSLAEQAVKGLMAMRRKEGQTLFKDIASRVRNIDLAQQRIAQESPRIIAAFENKLKSYLKNLVNYAQEKIIEEVGVFSRSIDISEELVRLKSHLNNFSSILDNKIVEKGRTLDFIAQEMQREANTMGAKSANIVIAKQVINIKSEIEKIREQLSNVE